MRFEADKSLIVEGWSKYFEKWKMLYSERQQQAAKIMQKQCPEESKRVEFDRLDEKYKRELYGHNSNHRILEIDFSEQIKQEASALYVAAYNIKKIFEEDGVSVQAARSLGMVWNVAGPVLCYLKSRVQHSVLMPFHTMIELYSLDIEM